jgi:hypothetical protein
VSAGGGSLIPRFAALAAALLFGVADAARAQEPLAVAPQQLDFLSRFDFHIDGAGMSEGDIRFHWATDIGGDADVVDYVAGRLSVLARYRAVLGDEFQPFDPNQNAYVLEASSSWRTRPAELAVAFNHVSRHLSDRERVATVAWNTLRGRALRQLVIDAGTLDLRGDAGLVTNRAFVDYRWMVRGEATFRRTFRPRVQWYARGVGESWGVDDRYGRSTQRGGRLESGLALSGRGAVIELFLGYEQVIDADAFELAPRRWPFAGFRLTSP